MNWEISNSLVFLQVPITLKVTDGDRLKHELGDTKFTGVSPSSNITITLKVTDGDRLKA